MASKSSKEDTVIIKTADVLTTYIDGKVIKQTIRKLKKIFGDNIEVHVMLGVDTKTDYDFMPADMIVLDSYKNPFVYPPLSDLNKLNHLISDTPLPQGYILYVVLQGVQKAYVYQFQNASSPTEYLTASPYLNSTSVPGGMVPCKDPTNPDNPPEEFLWNQEGPDQVYKIYKDKNGTKMYWQYNGDGAIVKLIENNAQALSVRLDFKP